MPTGYTRIIEDDPEVSLEKYAIGCAHAFGALVSRRDSCPGDDLPVLEVSKHTIDRVEDLQREVSRLANMTNDERIAFGEAALRDRVQNRQESLAKDALIKERYAKMRKAVSEWKVPDDLFRLRKFMLEQIDMCYDPKESLEDYYPEIEKSPMAIYAGEVKNASQSLEWAVESLDKERELVRQGNEWLDKLRACLNLSALEGEAE